MKVVAAVTAGGAVFVLAQMTRKADHRKDNRGDKRQEDQQHDEEPEKAVIASSERGHGTDHLEGS